MTTTDTHPTRTADRPPGAEPVDEAGERPARPAPVPGHRARFGWSLAVLTVAGLAVRLVYLLGWRHPWTPTGTTAELHRGANLLADGHGFLDPAVFHQAGIGAPGLDHPPGFVTVLAVFSWLGLRTFFQHQIATCLLGAVGVALMGLAGRRIGGERVGLIVAALVAFSPTIFYADALVMTGTLVVATTALVLLAAYRWWDGPSVGAAALFGAAVGAAGLVRPEALVAGPLVALPLVWWRGRAPGAPPPGARLAQLAAAALVVAVAVGPWAAYNVAHTHRATAAFSTELETTASEANCDAVYHGRATGYRSGDCAVIPRDQAAHAAGHYADRHQGRALWVAASRTGRTFGLYQPRDQIARDAADAAKEKALGETGLVVWYATAVAGAFGLVGLRRARRPIFPLVAVVAGVVLTSALLYGATALRLPAELALTVPAAVSLDAAVSALWANRSRRLAPPAVGIAEPVAAPADVGPGTEVAPEADVPAGPAGPDLPRPDTAADPPGGLGSAAGRFAGFDGMRALAALGVLITHCALQVGFSVHNVSGRYLARLDVGVAVFFALSGFLLYRPFVARRMDGRERPVTRDYLRNRFLRIYPGYWLALTVLAVVLDVRHRTDIRTFGDFVRYYALLQSYSKATVLGGLQQAWTLTNEIAFYLLLPLWAIAAAWLARRIGAARAMAVELTVLALGAAGSLALVFQLHRWGDDDVTTGTFDPRFHWLPANFHLFVPGMALAVLLEWSRRRERPLAVLEAPRRHPMLCWLGAAACFWAVSTRLHLGFQVGATDPGQAVVKEVLYAATGFLLVLPVALGGATLPRSLRWLSSRVMVVLGVLSYGIYLWHEGVTDIYRNIFHVPIFNGSFAPALAFTVVGSVAVAALSYVVIERPALALKDRHRRLFAEWRPVGLPADAVAA